jgi:CHAT domain-containing protein
VNFVRHIPRNKIDKLKELLKCQEQVENCPDNTDSVYTVLLSRIGIEYYMRADFVKAIEYTRQALDIVRTNIAEPTTDKVQLPELYYYLSIYYDSLNLIAQKNDAIDSCISVEMRTNTGYMYSAMVLETNVSDIFIRGDYNRCIERATLGEALIHKYYKYSTRPIHLAYFIYYKAWSLGFLGRYAEEEKFLQFKAEQLRKVQDGESRGRAYQLLGQVYRSKGEYAKAVESFQRAFYYDMLSSDKEWSAKILNQIGLIYSENLKQYNLALRYYQKALSHSVYRKIANASVSDSFSILGNMAQVFVKMKLFDSASHLFQKAFDKFKPRINEKDLALRVQDYVNDNNVEDVLRVVLNKADGYLERYFYNKDPKALQASFDVYKTADRLLNEIKVQLGDEESKLFWRRYSRRLYERAIEASYFLGNYNNAFYFFEKSRAVILADELNEHTRLSDVDALQLAEMKRKILTLKKNRDAHPVGSAEYTAIQHDILLSELDLNKLNSTIEKRNPLYYQSLFDTSSITLEGMGNVLSTNGQTLLELFNGDSSVYSLVITSGKTYLRQLNKRIFDSLSEIVTSYVSSFNLLNKDFSNYNQAACQLYRTIFQNINLSVGRIIISPDGRYFPFEALVTNENPLQFFVENYAVSYTYSARYLLNNFTNGAVTASGEFMGMAPVTYSHTLTSLFGSDQSLQRMDNYFSHPTILLQSSATKRNFLKEYYKYRIIQLYTHATDSGSTGEPVIYFADSTLSLSELFYESRPATSLIVLSACETAGGKLYNGEGVFSFNRQFASLGIPSCVSTLWKVDDQATYRITELFYKYIAKGLPMDIALQKAKKELKATSENRLPYYWAAPILVGKADAISLPKNNEWKWIVIVAIILLAVAFTVRYTRKKKF